MTFSKIALAAAAVLAMSAAIARADAITYDFTATVTSAPFGYYSAGQIVSGSFTYQTISGQPACDGTAGLCRVDILGTAITLVPNVGETPLSVTANANFDLTGEEQIGYTSDTSSLAQGYSPFFINLAQHYNAVNNVGPGSFENNISLKSSNSTLQSAPNLDVLPALSNFDLAAQIYTDSFTDTNQERFYTAQITSLTLQAAPEPASLVVLGSGLAALVLRRRRA
jgi:hypothetical protein